MLYMGKLFALIVKSIINYWDLLSAPTQEEYSEDKFIPTISKIHIKVNLFSKYSY